MISDDSEKSKEAEIAFREVAKSSKGKITFIISKKNDSFNRFEQISVYMGVGAHALPAVRIISGSFRYRLEEGVSKKNIERFISNFRIRRL